MSEDTQTVSPQLPEDRNVSSQTGSGEVERSRYKLIIYCGMDSESLHENGE